MGLIQSISRGAIDFRADVQGTPAAWDDYWYSPVGYSSAAGVRVNADSAKRIATVLACVGVISRNLGMMPIKIYTEGPNGAKRLVDHHPVYDVLYSRPNSQQTAYEFKQMMQGHVELRGNAYAEIKPGPRGAVDQLLPMHPDRVRVERMISSGRLRYRYDDPLLGRTRNLLEGEVFHLRNFSDDGMTGQSTVAMGVDVFGVALAQQDYSARFLKNDARPPIVFEGTGFKNKTQEDEFVKSWQRGHTGDKRGSAGILPAGITAKVLGISPVDQQLLDAQKFARIQICSMFGVPPHLIGETEKTATYASVEQFNIMYAVHCILPRLVMWEQAIQRDLLTSSRFFAKFSMAALLRGDTASRYAAYHTAIGDGWLSQDEARALEDMNPIPGGHGRYYWRPANWARLDVDPAPTQLSAPPPSVDDNQDPNQGEPGGEGTDAKAFMVREQLRMLATGVADRCVRKEVGALRKMIERKATDYDVECFYEQHVDFVKQAFNLDADRLVPLRQIYFDRAGQLCSLLAQDDKGPAFEFIDHLAAREPIHLAGAIVGKVAA